MKCEVEKARDETIKIGEDMAKSIQELEKALSNCSKCDEFDGCPILKDLNVQIEKAINIVLDEWGY